MGNIQEIFEDSKAKEILETIKNSFSKMSEVAFYMDWDNNYIIEGFIKEVSTELRTLVDSEIKHISFHITLHRSKGETK